MKKPILIVALLALVTAAGFFYYYEHDYNKRVDIWQLVPDHALFAYENKNTVAHWNKLMTYPVGKTLKKLPGFAHFEKNMVRLDSLSGKKGMLDNLLHNREFLVTAHIISSTEFDFLFFLDPGSGNGVKTFRQIINDLEKSRMYRKGHRVFQGIGITELKKKNSEEVFSFIMYDDFFIGSYTPFLVEDVIRNINGSFTGNFSSRISSLHGLSKLENDEGNLYIDLERMPEFFALFTKPELKKELFSVSRFADDIYFDVRVTENEILLNGVTTTATDGRVQFLDIFRNQLAQQVKITGIIPNQTAYMLSLTFSDFRKWLDALNRYWLAVDKEHYADFEKFGEAYQFNYDWADNELALAVQEPLAGDSPDRLLFIKCKDPGEALEAMADFSGQYTAKTGDSLFTENYNGYKIVQLGYQELPETLLGPMFHGFSNTYYTVHEKYLVIGNSMRGIKQFISDLENENVWGKSVRHSLFLENTLGESSISLMVNTGTYWQMLNKKLNERWSKIFGEYHVPLQSFDMMAFQVSNLDNRYYTSVSIGHHKVEEKPRTHDRFRVIQTVDTRSDIISRPFIVKNHNTNRLEALVQDDHNVLYLISNQGQIIWSDSLSGRIKTNVYQIDYYKNRKLQYLFATEDKIYLIDRKGNFVAGFPLFMKKGVRIDYLNVIDYDQTKKYRLMVADVNGSIYLFDKNRKNLQGWTPKKLGGRLASRPFHLRIKGGDCMIALEENGRFDVMNRRGNMYKGFPVEFDVRFNSPLYVETGNDFSSTKLVAVSTGGEIIQVNLKGKITGRKQLYKPVKESTYRLVPDALKKDFIIVRQDYNALSFLDRHGNKIFERNFITSGNLTVQYYNFSTDNKIFIVTDLEQEFTYIFNKEGELFNLEPMESHERIGLIYSSKERKYTIYKVFGNQYEVISYK